MVNSNDLRLIRRGLTESIRDELDYVNSNHIRLFLFFEN